MHGVWLEEAGGKGPELVSKGLSVTCLGDGLVAISLSVAAPQAHDRLPDSLTSRVVLPEVTTP